MVTLPYDELRRVPGLTEPQAAALAAAIELSKRGLDRGLGGLPKLLRPSDVAKIVSDLGTERQEHFVCLYLNARTQLIHRATISVGTLNGSLVHPREVFAPALEHNAAAMILCTPRRAIHTVGDDSMTQRYRGVDMGIEYRYHYSQMLINLKRRLFARMDKPPSR